MELQQIGAIACLPEAAAHELVGLDGFLARVEAVRDQNDHDLDLITRRLQLSCIELSHTNDRLRLELDSRIRTGDFCVRLPTTCRATKLPGCRLDKLATLNARSRRSP